MTPNHVLSTTGLMMPTEFDVPCYNKVHARAENKAQSAADLYEQFGSAWNALGYRYLAAFHHNEAFTHSIRERGDAPPQPERYVQERELFEFFANGLATLESFFYAMYALGAMLDNAAFPMSTDEDLRSINPWSVMKRYEQRFPGDVLTITMRSVLDSPSYAELRDVRNILAHRQAPGRIISAHISIGAPATTSAKPAMWKGSPAFELDEKTTSSRLLWLSSTTSSLLSEASAFVLRNIK